VRIATLVSALIALGSAGAALAQDPKVWGQVPGWEIKIDPSMGNGCFAWADYESGTVMRIGYHPETDRVYLLFGDPEWKSLKAGRDYRVKFVFDGRETFEDEMVGHDISGTVFLSVDDVNDDFIEAFAVRHAMEIFYQGKSIAHLSLKNTHAAIEAVARCQQSVTPVQKPRGGDPFK
jgi:hypothetical protein